jgi:DNA replication protein DnaC
MELASGTGWFRRGANLLMFDRPGSGKSHTCTTLGRALVENGHRVLFARTSDLIQRLQLKRQALQLEQSPTKLDCFNLLIFDAYSYVACDQAETSVLLEPIAAGYERRSLLVTANQPPAKRADRSAVQK